MITADSLMKWCACAVLLGWQAGCTVTPDYRPPQSAAPAKWSSSQAGLFPASEVRSDWWRTFEDPLLTQIVEAAARSNKDLAQAAARVREARALREVTASVLFPDLGASASVLRQTISENGLLPIGRIPGLPRRSNVFDGGFDAAWELDVFGGKQRMVEAAEARLGSVEEAERALRLSILGETARNYLELRGTQRQLAIVDSNAALQRRTLELTRDKLRIGTGTDFEVASAQAQVLATEARLPNLNAEIAAAAYRLSVLTGRQPGALLTDLLKREPLPWPPDLVPVGLPSGLLRRRPDVRRAERELAAATAEQGVALAERFPKFSLTGAVGAEALSFGDLFQAGSRTARLGPQIRWPILSGGRIRAGIAAADARAQAAAAAYEQAVLTALSETESALERYGRELHTRRKLQAAVAAQQRAVGLAKKRFDVGTGTLLEVIDAQSRLLAIESDLVQSETAVSLDLTALYKALGGGWER